MDDGDPINIIAGRYKGMTGVYKWPATKLSVVVKINGDTQALRTLRKTSVEWIPTKEPDVSRRAELDELRGLLSGVQELIKEVEAIARVVNRHDKTLRKTEATIKRLCSKKK